MPDIPRVSALFSNPVATVRDRSNQIDVAQMSPKMVVARDWSLTGVVFPRKERDLSGVSGGDTLRDRDAATGASNSSRRVRLGHVDVVVLRLRLEGEHSSELFGELLAIRASGVQEPEDLIVALSG